MFQIDVLKLFPGVEFILSSSAFSINIDFSLNALWQLQTHTGYIVLFSLVSLVHAWCITASQHQSVNKSKGFLEKIRQIDTSNNEQYSLYLYFSSEKAKQTNIHH